MDNGHRTERIGRVSMDMLTENLTGLDAGLCSVKLCASQTILSIALFAAHCISFFGYPFNYALPGKPA
jgi:alanine racemase